MNVIFQRTRGELIPSLVEECGGYGWTGNDLYVNYSLSQDQSQLRRIKMLSWPEEIKPRLCLLGPGEIPVEKYYFYNGNTAVAPRKYINIIEHYCERQQWYPNITFLDGQVERQIRKGYAELAFDIVYSGKTLREERLTIYDTIFDQSGFALLMRVER
ncbi:hypothetical protein HY496_00930 [Candidatus Woesearchaeota archaeon]|nr:hypothetical protein [Candidatus Woesearchaeota archaeon]